MSMKIGDVEIAKDIIELRHQTIRLGLIMEHILKVNPSLTAPSQEALAEIDKVSIEELRKFYPNMVRKK